MLRFAYRMPTHVQRQGVFFFSRGVLTRPSMYRVDECTRGGKASVVGCHDVKRVYPWEGLALADSGPGGCSFKLEVMISSRRRPEMGDTPGKSRGSRPMRSLILRIIPVTTRGLAPSFQTSHSTSNSCRGGESAPT